MAKYVYDFPDRQDWGPYYDAIANHTKWRQISTQYAPYLQGIKEFPGSYSTAAMIATRHELKVKLYENNLIEQYDWFIYSRSDYFYLCEPIDLGYLDKRYLHIPIVENSDGYSDRHWIMNRTLVSVALDLAADIVTNWTVYQQWKPRNNIEDTIKFHFDRMNIVPVHVSHSGMTIRTIIDGSRFSGREFHPILYQYGVDYKYATELEESTKWCVETLWRNLDSFAGTDGPTRFNEKRVAFVKCFNFPKIYAIYNRTSHEINSSMIYLPDKDQIKLIHCRHLHSVPLDRNPIDYKQLEYMIHSNDNT